ncbi:MAG: hypothetical protein JST63_13935, partial [Bacteroidetes bacterium]|nr:hypothetical protein [Bacteroidota bacterium]
METKKVLGLDIGTNSIGGALITLPKEYLDYGKDGNIEWMGSRIIPTDGDYLQKFESGAQAETKAAFRRGKRGSRRLKHRYKLRRSRLIKVFKVLGWIDETFPLDDSRKFKQNINENGYSLKISEYLPFSAETIAEFEKELAIEGTKSKQGKSIVPEDWLVYYLRKKALEKRITIQELVRIIYVLNQRRGFKSSRKDLKENTTILTYAEFEKIKNNIDASMNNAKEYETQFVSITTVEEIIKVSEEKDKNGKYKFSVKVADKKVLDFEVQRKTAPEWKGKEFTFLITQKIKKGKLEQLQPKTPTENDWGLCTTALDEKINNYRTPGEYFYEQIKESYKAKRNFKARQYPVYRWRYQQELEAIWKKQCELNPELNKINTDKDVLARLAGILYPTQAKNNMPKLMEFENNDLLHIISNDIIYYQRELKSQKNSISECRYEKRKGIDGELYGLKCIPRSSPLFQEFRIWQDIHNIRILKKEEKIDGKIKLDIDVSKQYITDKVNEKLFELFNSKASVSEKEIVTLIKECNEQNDIVIAKKDGEHSHRINLFRNRDTLKGNETLARYNSLFRKAGYDGTSILNDNDKLLRLWHIDYSITSSDEKLAEKWISSALSKLLPDIDNKNLAIELFCKLPELKKEYGSFSACAIKKLLPVMRSGKYWSEEGLNSATKDRIEKLINGEVDVNIDNDTRKKIQKWELENRSLEKVEDFNGLPTWLAGYVVYGIHSEREISKIKSVEDFSKFIQKAIPNNSLRNPIVEQVVRETMLLVRDVWKRYGDIDEIHIELGRNLKNNSDERKKLADAQKENFDEKQRIKNLLYELMNDGFNQYNIDEKIEHVNFEVNPNPESPADIDKFRIWRSLTNKTDIDWAKKVKEEKIPTEKEIKKYALWLSQNCRSPYTGTLIPLSKLFDTNQYEIEHIIPRARMKNDSFNNLVISEWGVNKAKDKQLAANFISSSNGKCKYGDKEYSLFSYHDYESYCKETFKFQRGKLKNLLATEVPEDFVERQLNDTRYIGRKLTELLAPVAKDENGILFTGGSITAELRNNWGLNRIWKEIILPRFERLEEITGKKGEYIIHDIDEFGNPVIHFNVKENQKLNTKRIDHRHHALDALIIAATTREHIRYLNTLNAADTTEELSAIKRSLVKGKIRDFKLPWENFTLHAKNKLEEIIVSFKTNNRITSQPKNKTAYFNNNEGKIKKEYKWQQSNLKWMAVRKSMFKEPQGIIHLKEVYEEKNILKAIEMQIDRMLVQNKPEMRIASYVYDQEARRIIKDLIERIGIPIQEKQPLLKEVKKHLSKNPLKDISGKKFESIKVATFEEYAAKRVSLDKSFDHKKIDKIPYARTGKSVLGRLLHEHLDSAEYKNDKSNADPSLAFSTEGLEVLAKKAGKPITKVTIYEKKDESSKFGKQYVEVDAGSNAFFVMYENKIIKERTDFRSIATHKAIEKIVNGEDITEDKEGFEKFVLSPGDLVYVPTIEDQEAVKKGINIENAIPWNNQKDILKRIYKVVSFSKKDLLCVRANIADPIIPTNIKEKVKGEIDWHNKSATTMEGDVTIKDVCIKVNVNRMGIVLNNNKRNIETIPVQTNILSEPELVYSTNKLKTFNSFEEADEENAKSMAALSPEEHIRNVTDRLKKMHEEELKKPMDKKL